MTGPTRLDQRPTDTAPDWLVLALADPGTFVPRYCWPDDVTGMTMYESLHLWQARAVLAALERNHRPVVE